jgi:hypothetical protein
MSHDLSLHSLPDGSGTTNSMLTCAVMHLCFGRSNRASQFAWKIATQNCQSFTPLFSRLASFQFRSRRKMKHMRLGRRRRLYGSQNFAMSRGDSSRDTRRDRQLVNAMGTHGTAVILSQDTACPLGWLGSTYTSQGERRGQKDALTDWSGGLSVQFASYVRADMLREQAPAQGHCMDVVLTPQPRYP